MSLKRHRLASPYCQHNACWFNVTLSANGDWRYGVCPLCNQPASERLRLPAFDPARGCAVCGLVAMLRDLEPLALGENPC